MSTYCSKMVDIDIFLLLLRTTETEMKCSAEVEKHHIEMNGRILKTGIAKFNVTASVTGEQLLIKILMELLKVPETKICYYFDKNYNSNKVNDAQRNDKNLYLNDFKYLLLFKNLNFYEVKKFNTKFFINFLQIVIEKTRNIIIGKMLCAFESDGKTEIFTQNQFLIKLIFLYGCNSKTNHCKYLKFSPNIYFNTKFLVMTYYTAEHYSLDHFFLYLA
ncbi:hypothetical protein AGLY_011881 [Aphis glycines]|uniref:Uncharacterized protein n=1 Tax=Aphis glycines TaxID=307491 RepID=A0A6G0TBV8_APHGL|nr:hypothetical protein AGLY_011881 [Aphis glycines]